GLPDLAVAFDRALDRIDDARLVEAGAGDLGLAHVFGTRAAQKQLVVLGALSVDAEDADVARMVVAAGIDAAADLDLQLAEVALALGIGEALGDLLRHRQRTRVR